MGKKTWTFLGGGIIGTFLQICFLQILAFGTHVSPAAFVIVPPVEYVLLPPPDPVPAPGFQAKPVSAPQDGVPKELPQPTPVSAPAVQPPRKKVIRSHSSQAPADKPLPKNSRPRRLDQDASPQAPPPTHPSAEIALSVRNIPIRPALGPLFKAPTARDSDSGKEAGDRRSEKSGSDFSSPLLRQGTTSGSAPAPVAEPEATGGSDPIAAYLHNVHRDMQRRVQRERGFTLRGRGSEETWQVSFHITSDGRIIFEEIVGGAFTENANRVRSIFSGLRLPNPPPSLSPTRTIRVPLLIKNR